MNGKSVNCRGRVNGGAEPGKVSKGGTGGLQSIRTDDRETLHHPHYCAQHRRHQITIALFPSQPRHGGLKIRLHVTENTPCLSKWATRSLSSDLNPEHLLQLSLFSANQSY